MERVIADLKRDAAKLATSLKERDLPKIKDEIVLLDLALKQAEPDLLLLEDDDLRKRLTSEYQHIRSKVDTVQESLSLAAMFAAPAAAPSTVIIRESDKQMQIKPLALATFSGDIREFAAWWSLFKVGVHDNERLTDEARFGHLKSALRGEAKRAIDGLRETSDNYSEALDELTRRYADTNKLSAAYYEDLENLPCSTTAEGQRPTLDSIRKTLKNLTSIGTKIDQDNLRTTILSKFNTDTIRECLRALMPLMDEKKGFSVPALMEALEGAVHLEELVNLYQTKDKTTKGTVRQSKTSPVAALVNSSRRDDHKSNRDSNRCVFCRLSNHTTAECGVYRTKEKRKEKLDELKLCYVCLADSHKANACSSKDKECGHCRRPGHQKVLCVNFMKERQERYQRQRDAAQAGPSNRNQSSTSNTSKGTFLETFIGNIKVNNKYRRIRGILDSGSEFSYVEDSLIQQLGLGKQVQNRNEVHRSTFGSREPICVSSGEVTITLTNLDKSLEKTLPFLTTPIITGSIRTSPPSDLVKQVLPIDYVYADSNIFHDVWEPIQVLIGCNFAQYEFLKSETIRLPTPRITLVNSIFGWIPSGELLNTNLTTNNTTSTLVCASKVEGDSEIDDLGHLGTTEQNSIEKLWSLEALGIRSSDLENTNDQVLERFRRTVRFEDNRFVVRWPWKHPKPKLPTNFKLCMARLKKLLETPSTDLVKYNKVIKEQLELGIIENAPKNPTNATLVHYLPHRGIQKNDKLRIVYDASAQTSTKQSLNDLMDAGPSLTEDMVGVLLNFRTHSIGMCADVEKAFLQIRLNEVDRDAVRFLWIKNLNQPLSMNNLVFYRFTSVLFGAKASPFLLNICLQDLLSKPPLCKYLISAKRNIYVDNVALSTPTLIDAIQIHDALVDRFAEASFNLRDWKTNNLELRKALKLDPPKGEIVPMLGYSWDTDSDVLSVKFEPRAAPTSPTKRVVLSTLASIFDPLGFASPCLLGLKVLVQECWKIKLGWNDILSPELIARFLKLYSEIRNISSIKIPRGIWNTPVGGLITLNIFCDASKDAFACVAYLTCFKSDTKESDSTMIFSKSRVAPIKLHPSIPNLELLAMLLGKRTAVFLHKKIDLKIDRTVLWTDATTVLQWLASPEILPKFVHNRITEIKQTPNLTFRHVPGKVNPADIASRGMSPEQLIESDLWWKGPSWLPHDRLWPEPPENTLTYSTATLATNSPKYSGILTEKLEKQKSSWDDYVKIFRAFMTLFNKSLKDQPKFLTFRLAENRLVLELQKKYFAKERAMLSKVPPIQPDHSLNLFLDREDGLIRCRGRLGDAYPYHTSNPILLPRESPITKLYAFKVHVDNLHMGCNFTLAKIRERFWIKKGRAFVKSIIHRCTTCRRWDGGSFQLPSIPSLPNTRTTIDAPFMYSGVDYLGPMMIVEDSKPGQKEDDRAVVKVYVCLFVCLVTRAIHLEAVKDMSANKFLMALERFGNRRGCPKFMISDNAANFKFVQPLVGTETEGTNVDRIDRFLSNNMIQWKFIPQYAPWHGGAYERLVALVKNCLRKCYRITYLDYDEFETALTKIEKVLNDRPLTYTAEDINIPLTPTDFLMPARRANKTVNVEVDITKIEPDRTALISSYRKTNAVLENFWTLFRKEYLLSLRERHTEKHPTKKNSLPFLPRKGEVVLIKEPTAPRAHWKLGVVLRLEKGDRTAYLRCNGKTTIRAINQLYPLEIPDETKTDFTKVKLDSNINEPSRTCNYLNKPSKYARY